MDQCHKTQRKAVHDQKLCELWLLSAFLWASICRNQWEAAVSFQYPRSKIYPVWQSILAAGFFHFWYYNGDFYFLHHPLYCGIRKVVLRMDLSANHFYG